MSRLRVQADDVGRVVRVLAGDPDDPTTVELSPKEAQRFGLKVQRAGEDAEPDTFAGEVADDQATLTEATEPERLSEMYDRLSEGERDRPEFGDVINPEDPLQW